MYIVQQLLCFVDIPHTPYQHQPCYQTTPPPPTGPPRFFFCIFTINSILHSHSPCPPTGPRFPDPHNFFFIFTKTSILRTHPLLSPPPFFCMFTITSILHSHPPCHPLLDPPHTHTTFLHFHNNFNSTFTSTLPLPPYPRNPPSCIFTITSILSQTP